MVQRIKEITGAGVRRVAGPDRFATAARVVAATFDTDAASSHVATGTRFPDALASGPAAAALDGRLLLTTGDQLPGGTDAGLERLGPSLVAIVGGTAVITEAVEEAAGEAADRGVPGT